MDALVYDLDRQGLPAPATAQHSRREQAVVLHRGGHINHAIAFYKSYLKHCPEDSLVWSNLGACLRAQKKYQAALACYYRALDIDPDNSAALGNLANVLKDLHRFDEANTLHCRVIKARPGDVQCLVNHASALREQRHFEAALKQLDRAQLLEPANAAVVWDRSQCLLHLGRYSDGLAAYESRWQLPDVHKPEFSCPMWRGEPLQGKHILLHAEQGYGDTMMAARYVSMVKDRGVTISLRCKPELHRLFRGIGADKLLAPDQLCDAMDYHCPLMSLMSIFTTRLEDVPPPAKLYSSLGARSKFKFLIDQNPGYLKVGIVWSGSVTFKNNHNRSAALERFATLAELEGVRLYSFQKGPRQEDLYTTGADAFIDNIAGYCEDFSDTAAAIEHMDVIVMTDSSLAHLAGSLGKPVINLLQYLPYWIYSAGASSTPWYPSHQLIKQYSPGGWDHVFAEAKLRLQRMVMEKPFQKKTGELS
jgi:tetratricopeptide (TPR) repeat protein